MLGIITCTLHNEINVIILYKQFNFPLNPQAFGLVTSSNSLPKGQLHLFIFVSCTLLTMHLTLLRVTVNALLQNIAEKLS